VSSKNENLAWRIPAELKEGALQRGLDGPGWIWDPHPGDLRKLCASGQIWPSNVGPEAQGRGVEELPLAHIFLLHTLPD
jgi:hypothetical protein